MEPGGTPSDGQIDHRRAEGCAARDLRRCVARLNDRFVNRTFGQSAWFSGFPMFSSRFFLIVFWLVLECFGSLVENPMNKQAAWILHRLQKSQVEAGGLRVAN